MTSGNVELHRRLIEMFNANDLEAWIALADPRIEWHSRFATVGAVTVYRGHEGLRRYASDMDDVWGGEARVEVEAYFDLGEQTLAFYMLRARGKHSGAETSMWFAQVARWHDGRYFYGKAYVDREEALAELGISEHELQPIAP
jgi:ketosteroid isomerase-like protein